jgi:hypothetical protein
MCYFRKTLEVKMISENLFHLSEEQYKEVLRDEKFLQFYEKAKGDNAIVFTELETLLQWSMK